MATSEELEQLIDAVQQIRAHYPDSEVRLVVLGEDGQPVGHVVSSDEDVRRVLTEGVTMPITDDPERDPMFYWRQNQVPWVPTPRQAAIVRQLFPTVLADVPEPVRRRRWHTASRVAGVLVAAAAAVQIFVRIRRSR